MAGFAGLALFSLARLGSMPAPQEFPLLVAAGGLGLLAADLGTGLVHWLGDRCFREETPWIGRVLIQPFREHHVDPLALTRHSFLEVTGNNALLLLPVMACVAWWAPAFGREALASSLVMFLWCGAWLAFASNPIHRWAHLPRVPAPVAWLQHTNILLSPAHHARHHRGAHDSHYCVATGWMNPIADRLGLFRALDRLRAKPEKAVEVGLGRL